MSTRGLYGFRMNGVDKTTYNHSDSYPDWLGNKMAEFCQNTPVEEMKDIFRRIVMVSEDSKPTTEQIIKYAGFYDGNVATQTPTDWYCLMRNQQGELNWMRQMEGELHMIDNHDFIKDSLFCEYAYIIDLDKEVLEFWIGFQKKPWEDNPYGTDADDGYYPCRLYAEFLLGSDPKGVVSQMEYISEHQELYEGDEDVGVKEDAITEAAEAKGWTVRFFRDGDNSGVCFSNSSPEGEDLELEFYYDDAADLVTQLKDNYDDFDVDAHVYDLLYSKMHGTCGIPSARDLVDDADEIEQMYRDLWEAVEEVA